jgi:hypothetical protein
MLTIHLIFHAPPFSQDTKNFCTYIEVNFHPRISIYWLALLLRVWEVLSVSQDQKTVCTY